MILDVKLNHVNVSILFRDKNIPISPLGENLFWIDFIYFSLYSKPKGKNLLWIDFTLFSLVFKKLYYNDELFTTSKDK